MQVISYVIFNGNCAEALSFYQKVFDAPAPAVHRYGEMPPDPNFTLPEAAQNLIMHAEMPVGGSVMYFSDSMPGQPFDQTVGDRVWITLGRMEGEAAARIYGRLKEGGTVLMELQKTFWSPAFAMLTDRFGIKWMINAE